MKCPKCGYLGFETTDRCRNCQYDFSLTTSSSEPDLTLRQDQGTDSPGDFEFPAIKRQTDSLAAGTLDLDRLFGAHELAKVEPDLKLTVDKTMTTAPAVPGVEARSPASDQNLPPAPFLTLATEAKASPSVNEDHGWRAAPPNEADLNALPFDDAPLLPPRAARTPLAVRRATPEIPRNRPRTTRPVRIEAPLAFEPAPAPAAEKGSGANAHAAETVASLMQVPALAERVGAGLIDLALLAALDVGVLVLTLRIAGLQTTWEDLRVIPKVPFVGFLVLLAFGYVAAFTVAGGQTIGKMLLKLRVISDSGRPIDAAGGVLRAVGCMLVPATLGLSYVPALFSSDHRALHDRLAGTRVVSE